MARQDSGGRPRRSAADVTLVAIAAIWGATFPLVQKAVSDLDVLSFLTLRFAAATLVLIFLAARRGGIRFLADPRGIAPGLCLAAGYWFQTEGLRTVSPSVSAFITGTYAVLVPVFAFILGWERTSARRWFCVALALIGIYLLQGKLPDRWTTAETWTALCAVAFALHIVVNGRVAPGHRDPLALGATQIVVATVCFTAIAAARGQLPALGEIRGETWFAALFTGLLATALAFLAQAWAQGRVPSSHVAICFANEPLFAAAISIAFFGDRLSPRGWLGAAAVIAATLMVTLEASAGAGRESPDPSAPC
jgi:drug/metabolite transporter (DMT)-like permease